MTANPLTDQLLAAADESIAKGPALQPAVRELARMLRADLPHVDEQLLGEILLHAGATVARAALAAQSRGWPADQANTFALLTLSHVGAVLYHKTGERS